MTKQLLIAGGILAVLVFLGAAIYLSPRKMPEVAVVSPAAVKSSITVNTTSSVPSAVSSQGTSVTSTRNTSTPPVVKIMGEAIYEYDYSIDKYLMGVSHNVFVAKIVKQVGQQMRVGTPDTQFEAQVISNIKGNAQGIITIEQEGGYLKGILYVPYEDLMAPAGTKNAGHLLEPGFIYVLAARHTQMGNPYTVVSVPSAARIMSQDSTLSNAQLQTIAVNDPRVKQLQAAYPNEVLDTADVYNKTAWNSYQSLTETQKAALPYYVPPVPKPAPTSTAAVSAASGTASSTH